MLLNTSAGGRPRTAWGERQGRRVLRGGHGRRRARPGPHEHHHVLPAQGGPRELDRVLAGRVSFWAITVQAPLAADVMDAVRQRQAPQLEPRSRYSVTLRAPTKPRNPAYPQPLRILVLVQDSGIRPTGDRVLISADRRALDRSQPT